MAEVKNSWRENCHGGSRRYGGTEELLRGE